MKTIFCWLGVAAICLCSIGCTKNEETESPSALITREFVGKFQMSKTTLSSGGKVSWCKGDKVSYMTMGANDWAKPKSITVDKTCDRASLIVQMDQADTCVWMAYGAEFDTFLGEDHLALRTRDQSGKFADAHIAIAKSNPSNGDNLTFINVTSPMKFTIDRPDVTRIRFCSNGGETIMASWLFMLPNGGIDISTQSGGYANGIYSSADISLDGSGTYYISSIPTTLKNGFTIDFYNSKNQHLGYVQNTSQVEIGQNEILNLGTLDARISTPELYTYWGTLTPSELENITQATLDSLMGTYIHKEAYSTITNKPFTVAKDTDNHSYWVICAPVSKLTGGSFVNNYVVTDLLGLTSAQLSEKTITINNVSYKIAYNETVDPSYYNSGEGWMLK